RLNRIGMIRTSALNARAVLQAGHKLLVFPGGDRESLRPFARRKEVVHPGSDAVARMALAFDAPLVPLVSAGGHESFVVLSDGAAVARALGLPRRFHVNVMPTALALPWGLVWGPGLGLPYLPLPAKVTAEVGEAIAPAAWRAAGAEALTDHVFGAMQSTLDRLYAERRWPVVG
ncbi:MAG: hypothetical protein KC635_14720, partial [Myxococcales bacterium]|nr:hypothetical protein [Myxococcales bacterium]